MLLYAFEELKNSAEGFFRDELRPLLHRLDDISGHCFVLRSWKSETALRKFAVSFFSKLLPFSLFLAVPLPWPVRRKRKKGKEEEKRKKGKEEEEKKIKKQSCPLRFELDDDDIDVTTSSGSFRLSGVMTITKGDHVWVTCCDEVPMDFGCDGIRDNLRRVI
ncbi:hypothetical protein AXF42_Ash004259 [Apostasia shenzhenica]|uniref:Uncharacterized protein n=1 Tax=Apostasia shenzhenica TaxID=1088818 RepID=A0A2I0A2E7_9ASPA|nr:hypothetical protein AXF42_Ash004259 [Apostasia shenzhenica]